MLRQTSYFLGECGASLDYGVITHRGLSFGVYVARIKYLKRSAYVRADTVGSTCQEWASYIHGVQQGIVVPKARLTEVTDVFGRNINFKPCLQEVYDATAMTEEEKEGINDFRERNSISGEHHVHLRLSDILEVASSNGRLMFAKASYRLVEGMEDATQHILATIMLFGATADNRIAIYWFGLL